MSKYNFRFSLARVDDDNEFVTHGVGAYDANKLPLKNVRKLIDLMLEHAKDLEKQADKDLMQQIHSQERSPNQEKIE